MKNISRVPSLKQRRGSELDAYFEDCLFELHRNCIETGKIYKYNQAQFAKFAKVSRETVRSHQQFIDHVLAKLNATRRTASGSVQVGKYLIRIEKLEAELSESRLRYEAIRGLYVDLFWLLHMQSIDVSMMALQQLELVVTRDGVCPLCTR